MRRVLFSCLVALLAPVVAIASPEFWQHEWPDTDFSQTTVENWIEVLSGGPAKDGIPSLSDPKFISALNDRDITDREPVISVEIDGSKPRAYPVRYLIWHEIVNDTVGGMPIAVTFCPLCNSGITFDRRVNGQTLSFGVTGKLRNSDMIMYDRETQSWWQQAEGRGIVGELTGQNLATLPTWMESWAEFKARNPDGLVMVQPATNRDYGRNPYSGYDSLQRPFLYSGELPPHNIPALTRVVRVGKRAWPVTRLHEVYTVTEAGITLSWSGGQASALDTADIGRGRDVGTIRVRDAKGQNIAHDVMFAFAFHAFWPKGKWMLGR